MCGPSLRFYNCIPVRLRRPNNNRIWFKVNYRTLCSCYNNSIHSISYRHRPRLSCSHHCFHKSKRKSIEIEYFYNENFQLARPKNRAKTVQFSKQAVICERDGELCLIVRAVNLRSSLLIDVSVTGTFDIGVRHYSLYKIA